MERFNDAVHALSIAEKLSEKINFTKKMEASVTRRIVQ